MGLWGFLRRWVNRFDVFSLEWKQAKRQTLRYSDDEEHFPILGRSGDERPRRERSIPHPPFNSWLSLSYFFARRLKLSWTFAPTFALIAYTLSRCFYNPTVLSLTGFRSQNTLSCVSRSFSFSRPPPRRQVVNEITVSGVARHAKLIKVCAPHAFRSRLPSSGAERTRARAPTTMILLLSFYLSSVLY